MTSALGTALPYGMRDCKLTPYEDEGGQILGDTSYDLPNMQTFSFSETEEFQELRGDDKTVTTRGRGAQVEWSLEAGGYNIDIWSILTGGIIIEEGLTPNRRVIMRKFSTASRRYFRMEGQSISDSGGDIHSVVYRCRANDTIEGTFGDGEFFITSASGLGLPLLDDSFDLLYDHIQNETATAIPLTPEPNPSLIGAPALTLGTTTVSSQVLNWASVTDATGYQIYERVEAGSWSAVSAARGGQPAAVITTTITALSASTDYQWRAVAKKDNSVSTYSNTVSATTPAS
jgi:hypothetical protein